MERRALGWARKPPELQQYDSDTQGIPGILIGVTPVTRHRAAPIAAIRQTTRVAPAKEMNMKIGTWNQTKPVAGKENTAPHTCGNPLKNEATKNSNFMSLTKSLLGAAAAAAFTLSTQAEPPPMGIAPVTVPAGGFSIDGEVVAGSAGVSAGDWMAG